MDDRIAKLILALIVISIWTGAGAYMLRPEVAKYISTIDKHIADIFYGDREICDPPISCSI